MSSGLKGYAIRINILKQEIKELKASAERAEQNKHDLIDIVTCITIELTNKIVKQSTNTRTGITRALNTILTILTLVLGCMFVVLWAVWR